MLGLASLVVAIGLVASAKAASPGHQASPSRGYLGGPREWTPSGRPRGAKGITMPRKAQEDVVEKALAKVREHVGLDLEKDLHGITLFGPSWASTRAR